MIEPREASAVSGVPQGEHGEDGIYYAVGFPYYRATAGVNVVKEAGKVSRILVSCDLPGLHCKMERVVVFDGDTVIFEAPLHNLEGVQYRAPETTDE